MTRRRARSALFPVNIWPPFVDALTLVLAAFVLIMLVAIVVQRGLLTRLRTSGEELSRVREEKARIERRLRAVAPRGSIDVVDGKVILQGEVLFATGSDELTPRGEALMSEMGKNLAALLQAEPTQMVLVGGHTDTRPIRNERFASNWELSTARALAVTRVLRHAGVEPARVVSAGFGEHHPRAGNDSDEGRQQNRRIEVLLVPITAVASR